MIHPRSSRCAITLLEVILVLAVLGVTFALMLSAIVKVRHAADRAKCSNHLRQIALAIHQFHDAFDALPPATMTRKSASMRFLSWQSRLLPFLQQSNLWNQIQQAFQSQPNFDLVPPHFGLITPLSIFQCPSDPMAAKVGSFIPTGLGSDVEPTLVAFTSYLGVNGTGVRASDGVLFHNSELRFTDIGDGTSLTLLIGERPPPASGHFGWWYAGTGIGLTGLLDNNLGVREKMTGLGLSNCPAKEASYQMGSVNQPCDAFHFWSYHSDGAYFAMADGSIHFLRYTSSITLAEMATRNGNDLVLPID